MNKLQGLYAITDNKLIGTDQLLPAVSAALRGGARLVQYRRKESSKSFATRLQEANALRDLCHQHNALLIINDDIALAKDGRADGVHLGKDDVPLAEARRALGTDAIIGISCYNDFSRAQAAHESGADYIAFGSFFPSTNKPDAPRADCQLLHRAREELGIPVCAIGGITPANGDELVNAGADMLAVIHGLFNTLDTEQAAQRYAALFAS